jgi:hypothetical protein
MRAERGTMAESRQQKRRTRVVNGRLQYRIIAIALTVVLASVLLFTGATVLSMILARPSDAPEARRILLTILPPLLMNDLAIMIVLIVVGVFATNRIAGPSYRMQSDIEKALMGERGVRVKLRRGDAFPELAEKVNELLQRVDDERKG